MVFERVDTFYRRIKRAGAQAPFDVYVCTCLWYNTFCDVMLLYVCRIPTLYIASPRARKDIVAPV